MAASAPSPIWAAYSHTIISWVFTMSGRVAGTCRIL